MISDSSVSCPTRPHDQRPSQRPSGLPARAGSERARFGLMTPSRWHQSWIDGPTPTAGLLDHARRRELGLTALVLSARYRRVQAHCLQVSNGPDAFATDRGGSAPLRQAGRLGRGGDQSRETRSSAWENSYPSMRSVGARTNTSHMMSGSCWLPLINPITFLPVASSITAVNRSRIRS